MYICWPQMGTAPQYNKPPISCFKTPEITMQPFYMFKYVCATDSKTFPCARGQCWLAMLKGIRLLEGFHLWLLYLSMHIRFRPILFATYLYEPPIHLSMLNTTHLYIMISNCVFCTLLICYSTMFCKSLQILIGHLCMLSTIDLYTVIYNCVCCKPLIFT